MEEILKQILSKIDALGEKIDANDRCNKNGYKDISRKLDSITEVVARTRKT